MANLGGINSDELPNGMTEANKLSRFNKIFVLSQSLIYFLKLRRRIVSLE